MFFQTKREKWLLERVDAAEHRLAELADQQRQFHEALMQRQTQSEQDVSVLRETFTSQIAQMRELVERQDSQYESLAAQVKERHHELDQLRDDLTAHLARQEEQTQQRLHEVETALTEQLQAVEQLRHQLAEQTEQQAATRLVQQRETETLRERSTQSLEETRQEVAADRATFTHHLEQMEAILQQLAHRTEALEGPTLAWQPRADTAEQQIAALRTSLQEEVQAREKLAQQVATMTPQHTTRRRSKPGV